MNQYLVGLNSEPYFTKDTLLKNVQASEPYISASSFYRMMKKMLDDGDIVRVGRNAYSIPQKRLAIYEHDYLEVADDLADYVIRSYPNLDFRIFELVQLNDFLNQLIGRNVIFLSVEEGIGDFLFEELRNRFNNNVLLNPTQDIFHRYWKEDMIVIQRLTTEAPKGNGKFWHTNLEKLLVDIMADRLLMDSFSESEYPLIYETSFESFAIDESQMFRYAKRRAVDQKIKNYLREKTSVKLKTVM